MTRRFDAALAFLDDAVTTIVRAKFSQATIDGAVAAAKQLPGKKSDPSKIKSSVWWDKPGSMPSISDVDFRDIEVKPTDLASLLRSNKTVDRDRLVWHCQNPGKPRNPSVFTTNPMVLTTGDGNVIVDGHHRLAALILLGQSSWPCWQLPSK